MDQGFLSLLAPFLRYAADGELTPASSLRELGLDSMRAVELLFALEDAYRVVIPDELLTEATFATPATIWTAIESLRVTPEAA